MKKRKILTAGIILAVVLAAGAGVYAIGGYGSADDPLISKSYLDQVLLPQLREEFRQEQGGTAKGSFELVTLYDGQTLTGETGCELLLRIGSACVTAEDSPGLVDTSSGSTIDDGAALAKNHLYMVSIRGNGITAVGGTAKLLVSGNYSIG